MESVIRIVNYYLRCLYAEPTAAAEGAWMMDPEEGGDEGANIIKSAGHTDIVDGVGSPARANETSLVIANKSSTDHEGDVGADEERSGLLSCEVLGTPGRGNSGSVGGINNVKTPKQEQQERVQREEQEQRKAMQEQHRLKLQALAIDANLATAAVAPPNCAGGGGGAGAEDCLDTQSIVSSMHTMNLYGDDALLPAQHHHKSLDNTSLDARSGDAALLDDVDLLNLSADSMNNCSNINNNTTQPNNGDDGINDSASDLSSVMLGLSGSAGAAQVQQQPESEEQANASNTNIVSSNKTVSYSGGGSGTGTGGKHKHKNKKNRGKR